MARPYALLRAGFPYVTTLGMRRVTNTPVDVAVDSEGVIYILGRGGGASPIRKLTIDDDDLGVVSITGADDANIAWPVNLIMDGDENLYISDEGSHRVTGITKDGQFLDAWGEHGDGDGQLDRPSGIAFDPDENVYVADTMNHRVQKFTKDGRFLAKWGAYGQGDGQFNMPWGMAVDELGDVYVADWRNDRVQKFSPDGEFLFKLGGSGSGDGEFNRPAGVEVDKDGDIYVADTGNNRIQLFSQEGRYVEKFLGDATLTNSGRRYVMANPRPLRLREMANLELAKPFRSPRSVTVDGQGRMYVPDYASFRVQIYQKDVTPLGPDQIDPPMRAPILQTT